jgi:uncharacterized protein YjbI with pentapeptide repeats
MGVILRNAEMRSTSLQNADLSDADLKDANLELANRNGADLNNVTFELKPDSVYSPISNLIFAKNLETLTYEDFPISLAWLREAFRQLGIR